VRELVALAGTALACAAIVVLLVVYDVIPERPHGE
jgi:hypothetical protein